MRFLNFRGVGVSPYVWNALPLEAVVQDGTVSIRSQVFDFESSPYPNGTKILVSRGRNIYCESLTEIEAEKVRQEQKRQKAHAERQEALVIEKQKNDALNESLNVPVKWSPEIKHCLSGLNSDRGRGDGCRKNTKVHIYLRESLGGRLARSQNSFLCAPSKGAHFNELIGDSSDSDHAVSCPQCLKIAERWQDA